MKKFVCLILCAVLTAGAAVTANAKTVKPHKGVEIYNSAKNIGNNTLLVSEIGRASCRERVCQYV